MIEQVEADLRTARLARDSETVGALSMLLAALKDAGFAELRLLDIDHINNGPYIRNTLKADKVESYEQALVEIYRVMRPGEPPTRETA